VSASIPEGTSTATTVALVRQPRRGPFRLSERAGNSASEHRVDDHVRIVEREVGGVGDGLGGDRGALEGVPVLASDLGPDRLGAPEQADGHVVRGEEARRDERVSAVVPASAEQFDARAGVRDRSDLAGDGVAGRLHQLLPRNAEGGRVSVDRRHSVGGYHARLFARRMINCGAVPADRGSG
jgi:hypothetical protein